MDTEKINFKETAIVNIEEDISEATIMRLSIKKNWPHEYEKEALNLISLREGSNMRENVAHKIFFKSIFFKNSQNTHYEKSLKSISDKGIADFVTTAGNGKINLIVENKSASSAMELSKKIQMASEQISKYIKCAKLTGKLQDNIFVQINVYNYDVLFRAPSNFAKFLNSNDSMSSKKKFMLYGTTTLTAMVDSNTFDGISNKIDWKTAETVPAINLQIKGFFSYNSSDKIITDSRIRVCTKELCKLPTYNPNPNSLLSNVRDERCKSDPQLIELFNNILEDCVKTFIQNGCLPAVDHNICLNSLERELAFNPKKTIVSIHDVENNGLSVIDMTSTDISLFNGQNSTIIYVYIVSFLKNGDSFFEVTPKLLNFMRDEKINKEDLVVFIDNCQIDIKLVGVNDGEAFKRKARASNNIMAQSAEEKNSYVYRDQSKMVCREWERCKDVEESSLRDVKNFMAHPYFSDIKGSIHINELLSYSAQSTLAKSYGITSGKQAKRNSLYDRFKEFYFGKSKYMIIEDEIKITLKENSSKNHKNHITNYISLYRQLINSKPRINKGDYTSLVAVLGNELRGILDITRLVEDISEAIDNLSGCKGIEGSYASGYKETIFVLSDLKEAIIDIVDEHEQTVEEKICYINMRVAESLKKIKTKVGAVQKINKDKLKEWISADKIIKKNVPTNITDFDFYRNLLLSYYFLYHKKSKIDNDILENVIMSFNKNIHKIDLKKLKREKKEDLRGSMDELNTLFNIEDIVNSQFKYGEVASEQDAIVFDSEVYL